MAQAIGRLARGLMRTEMLPAKSSASFKAGHMLIWNNGVDRHSASDANLGATGSTTRIVGMALNDSTRKDGPSFAMIDVMVAEPGTQFSMPIYHGTPASAVATPNGQIGTAYELRNVGGNYDSVDVSATTNTKCIIVGYDETEYPLWPASRGSTTQGLTTAGTTQYPNAWIEFVSSACALTGAGR